ncbi:adenosylcobinamide-GDP ribazoletransferase [Synergistales bacterium]|nr:adenosylcobinamide-GDP ribazoletransferase [Synergistales bacterium]
MSAARAAKYLFALFSSLWLLITRIPLPRLSGAPLPSGDALALMPIAGALFSLICAVPALLAAIILPAPVSAWIGCGIYIIAGWSLHLDGWGDMWDGIGSGRSGPAMRDVMKDSHTGSFGVMGIVIVVALRASLFGAIPSLSYLGAAALAGGAGRFAADVCAYFGRYPWGSGIARSSVNGFGKRQLAASIIALCVLFPINPLAWALGSLCSAGAGAALALWSNNRLGGVNGDILGASCVLGELIVLCAWVVC